MTDNLSRNSLFLAGIISIFSIIAYCVNYYNFQFPGNSFFPPGAGSVILLIGIFNIGLALVFEKNDYPRLASLELLLFVGLMVLIAFASNQIQLTPFSPIDKNIINFESMFGFTMQPVLSWTHQHPLIQRWLAYIYDSLPWQMTFLPLLLILFGKFDRLRKYYFMMLFTALFGFSFYYFFPTTAPASWVHSPYFSNDQIDTGLKFKQIHQHIKPTTNKGGLIALPSFHVIWAILCVFLVAEWRMLFILLAVINCILIISCVFLGWHYPTDVIAGLVLVTISYKFMRLSQLDRNASRIG